MVVELRYSIPNLKLIISRRLIQKITVNTYLFNIYKYDHNTINGEDVANIPANIIIETIYESMVNHFSNITMNISERILELVLKTSPNSIDSHLLVNNLTGVINRLYNELKHD